MACESLRSCLKDHPNLSPSITSLNPPKIRTERSFYLQILFLCVALLIGIIYCQFPHFELLEKCRNIPVKETIDYVISSISNLRFLYIPGLFFKLVKALSCGLVAIYYSWEIIYLDSVSPGIQPPSPLSPSRIRSESERTFDLNHLLAVVNGVFFAVLIFFWP